MMKLFHGSNTEVAAPLVKLGRTKVDFGQGFYLTKLETQAEAWANVIAERRKRARAVVSTFLLDLEAAKQDNYTVKTFDTYNLNSWTMSSTAAEEASCRSSTTLCRAA